MIGILANLAIIAIYERVSTPIDLAIGAVALILNVAAWMLFLSGRYAGFIAERALSAGRMVVPIAAATILLSYPVMTLSPLSVVLWIGVLRLWIARGNQMLWLTCAILLGLRSHTSAASAPIAFWRHHRRIKRRRRNHCGDVQPRWRLEITWRGKRLG